MNRTGSGQVLQRPELRELLTEESQSVRTQKRIRRPPASWTDQGTPFDAQEPVMNITICDVSRKREERKREAGNTVIL